MKRCLKRRKLLLLYFKALSIFKHTLMRNLALLSTQHLRGVSQPPRWRVCWVKPVATTELIAWEQGCTIVRTCTPEGEQARKESREEERSSTLPCQRACTVNSTWAKQWQKLQSGALLQAVAHKAWKNKACTTHTLTQWWWADTQTGNWLVGTMAILCVCVNKESA